MANESWRMTFEQMNGSAQKFEYLSGLADLSWSDCQDAWFEARKLIPEVAKEVKRLTGIEKDHMDDWRRIQDAERKIETAVAEINRAIPLIRKWVNINSVNGPDLQDAGNILSGILSRLPNEQTQYLSSLKAGGQE